MHLPDSASMKEGRFRPSFGGGCYYTYQYLFASMKEGRFRPSFPASPALSRPACPGLNEGGSVPTLVLALERSTPHWSAQASMKEGRFRPSFLPSPPTRPHSHRASMKEGRFRPSFDQGVDVGLAAFLASMKEGRFRPSFR